MLRSKLSVSFLFHKFWVLSAIIDSSLKIKNSYMSNTTNISYHRKNDSLIPQLNSVKDLLIIIVAELTFGYMLSEIKGSILGCCCFKVDVLDIVQGTVQSR